MRRKPVNEPLPPQDIGDLYPEYEAVRGDPRFGPDKDDPFLVLAGEDKNSMRTMFNEYVPHWLPRIEAWAAAGLAPQEMDSLLSLSPGTIKKISKSFPEIHAAISTGYAVSKHKLLRSAYQRAIKGDTKLTTFLLSALYGVSERKEVDISNNITITALVGENGEIGKTITTEDIREASMDAEFELLPEGDK